MKMLLAEYNAIESKTFDDLLDLHYCFLPSDICFASVRVNIISLLLMAKNITPSTARHIISLQVKILMI